MSDFIDEKEHKTTPLHDSISEERSNCILIEGWVDKKSRYLRRWRKRWLVMEHKSLRSYKTKQDFSKPTETIDLTKLSSIDIIIDNNSNSSSNSNSHKYCFDISIENTPNKFTTFSLSTQSESQQIEWINQLRRIMTINQTTVIIPNININSNLNSNEFENETKTRNDSDIENSNIDNNNNNYYGCKHYRRNCYIKSECCNNWYYCSYCHDDKEDRLNINTQNTVHTLDRNKIYRITCVKCGKEQKPSNYCINPKCGIKMAKYYCKQCKFWNNDPNVQLFHCNGCGLCRTGKQDDYKHCDKCGVCLSKGYYAVHKCIEQATQCDCPICGDFLHMSDKPVTFWPNCGHGIHVDCMNEFLKFDSLCAVCRAPWIPDITNLS